MEVNFQTPYWWQYRRHAGGKKMADYFVHESSYVDENVSIGVNTKIWHFSHIQKGVHIGRNCTIGQNVNIANNVCIGDGVKIQNNVSVYEGVMIEDGVFLGPSCVFTNVTAPRAEFPRGREGYEETIVKHGASIGANATIVCGNMIGKYALVGAGAVVVNSVKNHALVMGVPAMQKGWVCKCGEKLNADFKCDKCKKEYRLSAEGLEEIQQV